MTDTTQPTQRRTVIVEVVGEGCDIYTWVKAQLEKYDTLSVRDLTGKVLPMQRVADVELLREIEQWFEFYLAWSTEITTQGRGMVKGILTRLRAALDDAEGGG